MKSIAVPLLCLLFGSAAGYGFRSWQSGDEGSQVQASSPASVEKKEAHKPGGTASVENRSPSSVAGEAAAPAQPPLADLLQGLLADYDVKSAQKAFASLSAADIQKALGILFGMPKGNDRDLLQAQLYRAWAKIDPNEAWKAALTDPQERNRALLLGTVAGELAKTDPKAAIALAQSLGMGGTRASVMGRVLEEWSTVDVAAAITYANANPEQMGMSTTFSRGISKLADTQPLRAADLAASLKDSLQRNGLLSAVMNKWMDSDPEAAMKWADGLTNYTLRKDAISAAISAWAKIDPAAALAHAQSLPDADIRMEAVKKGWSDWFRKDPSSATRYMAAPENESTLLSLGYSLGYLTEGFSAAERASLLAQFPDGKAKEDIVRSVIDWQLRKGQYNQSLELLNAMPDSDSRDRSVAKLGEEWAVADLAAAAAWLKIQPDSTDRDLAVAGFSRELARTDPAGALEWVKTIPDEKLRVGAMRNVAIRWFKKDAAQAEAWMNGIAEFSMSDKKMIRDMAVRNLDMLGMPLSVGQRH